MLRDGYGVEDIGVTLVIPADHVRTLVACLRRSGRLLWVLGVADG